MRRPGDLTRTAALGFLADQPDEFIVNIHLLRFYAVRSDRLLVYHDFLDQLVKNVWRQLLQVGILPNQRDELLDIIVEFIIPGISADSASRFPRSSACSRSYFGAMA